MLALSAVLAAAQNVSPDRIAERFFPDELQAASSFLPSTVRPEARLTASAILEKDNRGNAILIFAAYSNGSEGAIRLLERRGNDVRVVPTPSSVRYKGAAPFIRLVDLDGDGRDEVMVSFHARISSDHVFKIVDRRLLEITPTDEGPDGTYSLLSETSPVDIDHNGRLHLLSWEDVIKTPYPPFFEGKPVLYRFTPQGYLLDRKPIAGMFVHAGIAEEWREFEVVLPDGAEAPFTMTVVNGVGPGRRRVATARVFLNGKQVVGSAELNTERHQFVHTVQLRPRNTLRVNVEGDSGVIFIMVEDSRKP